MYEEVIKIIDASGLPGTFFSAHRHDEGLDIVPPLLEAVRTRGDEAIREFAKKFDRADPYPFEIAPDVLKEAEENLRKDDSVLYDALCLSRDLALKFAGRQRESFIDFEEELSPGLITGQKIIPVERAGLYVPAGRYPLLSTVIMCAAPAKAAGVKDVILCTPPAPRPDNGAPGEKSRAYADANILAAASLCGIARVYAIGGAQAIAAMAYGTETVPRANVIVGPGNKYVTAAKKLIFGEAGIDLLAGPTEVMIIADNTANPAWVAADMFAQAEHDSDAQAVLITADRVFAEKVRTEIGKIVSRLSDDAAARKSFARNGWIILVKDLQEAPQIANRKCPEHLELALDPGPARDTLEKAVHNYGSVFIGHRAAEVLGDYAAGLNHTLPTSGSAAFTGGLSVRHFLKTVTSLRTKESVSSDDDLAGWEASMKAAERIALAEGLTGHALAAAKRLGEKN
ncbi:histidinol dehydrogenase [Brucepastera parasyntrophica]|uniref:histidinol dehydrogenase n=1 Tax=Brucepastera parasyntrophica TaxID=2880008 RepID=UPI00210D761F|nr:histidinol dehydrogenase [Brucepastera parasyntrophica]ULQ58905.1 histidinol dehydrogenase [Brucepastera parasyntrophica]